MGDLVTPDDLPNWVPGEVTVDSAPLGWQGLRVRGYRYAPLDVPIPGMRDYIIVAYKDGATTMNRRSTGEWRKELVAPGCVSLLTHAAQSHWRWSEDIEVTHLYLSPGAMADVAAEAYDCHIKEVELRDILKADDPVLAGIAASLAQEAREAGLGGRLYVELAEELRLRPHSPALRECHLSRTQPLRGAFARPMPAAQPVFRRKLGSEHIIGGTCGGGRAQRVSLRA